MMLRLKENTRTVQESRESTQIYEGYKFTAENNAYSHLLLCKICTKLMIEPMRLYPCGHTFCKSCILDHNKKLSVSLSDSKQNKCFVNFPQCGKYYITLQSDILAASLIDDLEVRCLSDGCPWVGPLQRFKLNHKNQCKLKQGGLNSWLQTINEGAKIINKERKQRKNNTCIDVEDDLEIEQLVEDSKAVGLGDFKSLRDNTNKTISKLIKASCGPTVQLQEKTQSHEFSLDDGNEVCEITQVVSDSLRQRQIKPLLGLTKHKVGNKVSLKKSPSPSIVVDIEDQDSVSKNLSKRDSQALKRQQKTAIILDQDLERSDKSIKVKDISDGNYNADELRSQIEGKQMEKNYTGLKMINSYKKKSHKIAQNPHNMSLTRSQPQVRKEDQANTY